MKFLMLLLLCVTSWSQATESVMVYNISQHRVEYQQDVDSVRSIASITKLMTAMIVLDHNRDLEKKLVLNTKVASRLPKQQYSQRQLLEAMLIYSDNAAAETLAEDFPGGRSTFVKLMNQYARNWELKNTRFIDPSGLSPFNVSTARELTELVYLASSYWFIKETGGKKHLAINTTHGKKTRRIELFHTSGNILDFNQVVMSKTGLTAAAGWCVGMVVDRARQQYVVVVLGSKTKAARFSTVKTTMTRYVVDN
jgi:D-alanyl-D-alanine endopeptidase (penicillin-binding protein 7)